jgi:hypothetical protein
MCSRGLTPLASTEQRENLKHWALKMEIGMNTALAVIKHTAMNPLCFRGISLLLCLAAASLFSSHASVEFTRFASDGDTGFVSKMAPDGLTVDFSEPLGGGQCTSVAIIGVPQNGSNGVDVCGYENDYLVHTTANAAQKTSANNTVSGYLGFIDIATIEDLIFLGGPVEEPPFELDIAE